MDEELDKNGYCVNWSIFLLDLRLKYYKYNPKQIQTMLIEKAEKKGGRDSFLEFIRNYTNYIDKFKFKRQTI